MEHLIIPKDSSHWIKVTYDATPEEYYEASDPKTNPDLKPVDEHWFLQYPSRAGWTLEEVAGSWKTSADDEPEDESEDVEDVGTEAAQASVSDSLKAEALVRSPSEVEKFFQTWLLFGLIIETLRLCGVNATTEDFLEPLQNHAQRSHSVTTAKLPNLIRAWGEAYEQSRRVTADSKTSMENGDKLLKTTFGYCSKVAEVVDYYCANGKRVRCPEQYGEVKWPVRAEITTSIIAVASTLRKAAHNIYGGTGFLERWPVTNSSILHKRIGRKWCSSDCAMIMEDLDIDGQYFIAASQSRGDDYLDEHHSCTSEACLSKVNEGTYITKHSEDCDGSDVLWTGYSDSSSVHDQSTPRPPQVKFGGHVGPDFGQRPTDFVDGVKKIMGRMHLPFVIWNAEEKSLSVSGYAKSVYVENQGGFNTPPFVAISHVWSNGMGNPFDNMLPECLLRDIQKMVDNLCFQHLNVDTSKKPGFWMDTLCCLVGEDNKRWKKQSISEMREIYSEAMAVLVIDPWLEELSLTADKADICYRLYTSGWCRRLWTHQEGFLAKDVFLQLKDGPLRLSQLSKEADTYQKQQLARGYPLDFVYLAQSKTASYYHTVRSVVDGIIAGHLKEETRSTLYLPLAKSLGYRATTKTTDELLCVASIMALKVQDFLDISIKSKRHLNSKGEGVEIEEATAQRRMVEFLTQMKYFPQGIIFNTYKRLRSPGWRWAPASMLGHRSSGLGDMNDSAQTSVEDFSGECLDARHIYVPSLRTNVNITQLANKSLQFTPGTKMLTMLILGKKVSLPTFGLPVDYPGYRIKFVKGQHKLTISMAERRFGVEVPGPPVAISIQATAALSAAVPVMVKTPSLPKVPTIRNFGRLGRGAAKEAPAPAPASVEAVVTADTRSLMEVSAISTTTGGAPTRYVVFVAENKIKWKTGESYVLILQKPLDKSSREFLAMLGRSSAGPGSRIWVESLCSAVVRLVTEDSHPRMATGLDFLEVSEPRRDWVVT